MPKLQCNVGRNVLTGGQLENVKIRFAMLLSLTLCRIIAAFTECIVSD